MFDELSSREEMSLEPLMENMVLVFAEKYEFQNLDEIIFSIFGFLRLPEMGNKKQKIDTKFFFFSLLGSLHEVLEKQGSCVNTTGMINRCRTARRKI